jgi:predicted deacylase
MSQTTIEDTATLIKVLREMGMSYQETVSLLSKSLNDANISKQLVRGENKGPVAPLIKLGITVFLVPVPVISESLGIILMSAGVFQSKVRGPPIQIDDVYETCQRITKELRKMKL